MREIDETMRISALRRSFLQRTRTPSQVLEQLLARIEARDGDVRAVVGIDADRARAAARASDRRYADGAPLSPLDGVPIGVKANIAIANRPWTAAMTAYRARIARADAFSVALLRAAGALPFAHLNMHEAALGATTDGPLYGKCFLPGHQGLTPGGSSGGSAAAVAAGFVPLALGTDTMGSVRIPSAYCGIVGFKPSYARISTGGVVPLSWTLDHLGLHANSVADVREGFALLDVTDPEDAYAEDYSRTAKARANRAPRVGRVRTGDVAIAPSILAAFDAAMDCWAGRGAEISELTLDSYGFGKLRRQGLLVCEVEGAVVHAEALAEGPSGFSPGLKAMLDYGARQSSVRYAAALNALAEVRVLARRAFATCDVLALPTAPQTAFAHNVAVPDNQADLTAFANFAGLPAITLPIGKDEAGLSIGVQLVAKRGADHALLAIAHKFEAALKESAGGASRGRRGSLL